MRLRLAAYLAEAYDAQASEDWHKKYDDVWKFSEGFAKVILYGKGYGFVNTEGKEVIPPKYDEMSFFHEGFAQVRLDDKWGFINKKGVEVVEPQYDRVGHFHEGLAEVKLKGKWGYINTEGVEVVKLKYDLVWSFRNGFAKVRIGDIPNRKYGFVNTKGEEVVPPGKYDEKDLKSLETYLKLGGNLDVILLNFKLEI